MVATVHTFDALVFQPLIDEILHVTSYERIQEKYSKVREGRLEFSALISGQAIWIDPKQKLGVIIADEADNRYVECAVADHGQYIISGDDHLLELGEYEGIVILTPAAFVTLKETGQT